jgi:hypothetical protein
MDDNTDTIRELWEYTDISQAGIAVIVGVTPDSLSRFIAATYTKEERQVRLARVQHEAQTAQRVAKPAWYLGKGKSVLYDTLKYCEANGLRCLPPGMTTVKIDGELRMVTKLDAKKLKETLMLQDYMRRFNREV